MKRLMILLVLVAAMSVMFAGQAMCLEIYAGFWGEGSEPLFDDNDAIAECGATEGVYIGVEVWTTGPDYGLASGGAYAGALSAGATSYFPGEPGHDWDDITCDTSGDISMYVWAEMDGGNLDNGMVLSKAVVIW